MMQKMMYCSGSLLSWSLARRSCTSALDVETALTGVLRGRGWITRADARIPCAEQSKIDLTSSLCLAKLKQIADMLYSSFRNTETAPPPSKQKSRNSGASSPKVSTPRPTQ